jgi:hypothetical protein
LTDHALIIWGFSLWWFLTCVQCALNKFTSPLDSHLPSGSHAC